MSFGVAVQSAIFYVVSCTPCLQARHHQKSKAKAKKEREEKARIQAENPDMYKHPDPFDTNPYWTEEIMMGPRILSKKYTGGNGKNNSQKRLNSSGKESTSVVGSSTRIDSMSPGSSHTAVAEDAKLSFSTTLTDDWNRKRYQREDEELWGHEVSRTGHKLMDVIKQAGSSVAGRILEAKLGKEPKPVTEEERHNFYFAPRNPPVNEYHPPIVRQKPTHKDANRWMLQPPPSAKVMEGKVPVSRSGSLASHLSRKTTMSDGPNLGRLVHERAVEAKLRSGELPTDYDSTPTLHKSVTRKNTTLSRSYQTHRVTRSRSLSLESSDASDGPSIRRSYRGRQPVSVDFDTSDEEYFLRSSDSFGRGRRVARRPKLQPISSSRENEADSKENVPTKVKGDQALTRTASSALADVTNSSKQPRSKETSSSMVKSDEEHRDEELYKPSPIVLGPLLQVSS